jgi:hypothetical protein
MLMVHTKRPQVYFNFTSAIIVKVRYPKTRSARSSKIKRQFISHEFANIRRPAQITNWTEWIRKTRPRLQFFDHICEILVRIRMRILTKFSVTFRIQKFLFFPYFLMF